MKTESEMKLDPPQPRAVAGLRTGQRIKFEKTVTINRHPSEVYTFWRQLENLPLFMSHLAVITVTGDNITHWVAQTDQGKTIEWDAGVIEDKPEELICWESLPGAEVQNAGCVRFTPAPGQRGTVVRLTWSYVPGGGKFGARLATVMNKRLAAEIAQNLFNLRSLLETGEIPTVEGQPHGGKSKNEHEPALA